MVPKVSPSKRRFLPLRAMRGRAFPFRRLSLECQRQERERGQRESRGAVPRGSGALGGVMAARCGSGIAGQARGGRTHRLILLGAWVLARREKLEEFRDLVASEPAGCLEQGKMLERKDAFLTDVLGK